LKGLLRSASSRVKAMKRLIEIDHTIQVRGGISTGSAGFGAGHFLRSAIDFDDSAVVSRFDTGRQGFEKMPVIH